MFAVVLTYCSFLCVRSCVYIMVISENGIGVYNSFTASLMFLEKVVQKAITMCTMGERVGVWFTSLLRH